MAAAVSYSDILWLFVKSGRIIYWSKANLKNQILKNVVSLSLPVETIASLVRYHMSDIAALCTGFLMMKMIVIV